MTPDFTPIVEILEPASIFSTQARKLVVTVYYPNAGVDRSQASAWELGAATAANRALAERMKTAIEAGAVYSNHSIKQDVYGQTYVSASGHLLGRRLNADLKALGY